MTETFDTTKPTKPSPVSEWWGERSPKEKRLALIALVLTAAAGASWAIGGNFVPPAIALVVALTNLLGGAWKNLSTGWWVLIWVLALLAAGVTISNGFYGGWTAPNALGASAAVANMIVLFIRVRFRD